MYLKKPEERQALGAMVFHTGEPSQDEAAIFFVDA